MMPSFPIGYSREQSTVECERSLRRVGDGGQKVSALSVTWLVV